MRFLYETDWAFFFSRIAASLPNLHSFSFDFGQNAEGFFVHADPGVPYGLGNRHDVELRLFPER